jgi:tetratricopeptide (TPR) repeat protein
LAEAAIGHHTAALECYDRALRLVPDFAEAQFNKSLTCLLLGNFAEGWRLWEARKRKNNESMTLHQFRDMLDECEDEVASEKD